MNKIILGGDPRDFLIWREASGQTVEIFDIAVGSERGQGKGWRLVEMLKQGLTASGGTTMIWALTRDSNLIACQFYAAIGFRCLGRLERFHGGEDAVAWGLDL